MNSIHSATPKNRCLNFLKPAAIILIMVTGISMLLTACNSTPKEQQVKEIKLLTIGNSFADSAFKYLPSVVKSVPGCKIVMDRANIGGCSLDRHWKEVEKSQKNPKYKPYYKKYTLKEKLQLKKWDVVTMQQVSSKSFKLKTYEPYFGNLYKYVHEYAPQAEIVIQMTWSYRPDHWAFGKWGVSDPDDMFRKLFNNYLFMAKKYNCRIIPTGLALHLAREQQKERFVMPEKFNASQYTYPAKPKNPAGTFINGYHWRKYKDGHRKLNGDLIHFNNRGRYLQACVWFAKLFNKPTSLIKFAPKDITAEDAAFLRKIAQEAVDQSNKDFPVKYPVKK